MNEEDLIYIYISVDIDISFSLKKEGNLAICNNKNGT